jgi:hypothetical protein
MAMKMFALILLSILLACCSNEKSSSIVTLDVLTPDGSELTNLSEIATDIQYIPLETSPKTVMRFLNYLKATEDKYYFNTVLELLCFDKNGKFLYKLDSQGRGPEEYTFLTDYDILPEKRQIMVLASSSNKLLFYNETDSGFQYEKKLNLKIRPSKCDFMPNQDNILLTFGTSTGDNIFQCVVINYQGDTIFIRPNYSKFQRITNIQMGFPCDPAINRVNNVLRIKSLLSDTIFSISNDYDFTPYIILTTGGRGLSSDFLANIPAPIVDGGSPAAKLLHINAILETDRFFLYKVYYQDTNYWGVLDRISGEVSHFQTKNLLKDDISGGINIEPKFCYDGVLYSWVDALTFKKLMAEKPNQTSELKNQKRALEVQRLAESIKEDDNHILIVITPKK